MLLPVLLLCIAAVYSEEGPPPSVQFAKRMFSTLPELPEAIAGSLEGKPDGIKNMISTVLGDGLISQLVVNPMGVAEEVLPDLRMNKTGSSKSDSGSLFGKGNGFLNFFTTTQKTTTPEVMLVDGVPVKDFDEYIRRNKMEGVFTTKKPPPPTTKSPTAEEIADMVASRINTPAPYPPTSLHNDDFGNKFDLAMVDPRRIGEVNSLLRRAPQHFDTLGSPPGFMPNEPSPMDPALNEVVTSMRTRGADGLSVEDIKRMKNILETYEASLQTKEFISKRNQLQVLQVELEEQKKRIELQKKMEKELHAKAKEIEIRKAKMEAQLREQLHSWNLSHLVDMQDGPRNLNNLADLPELNPSAFPQLVDTGITGSPPAPSPTAFVVEEPTTEMSPERSTVPTTERPRVHSRDFRRYPQKEVRYSPRVPVSTAIRRDQEQEPQCECVEVEPDALSGHWIPALASKTMLADVYEKLSSLLSTDAPAALSCSRIQVSPFKKGFHSTEARMAWEFKTNDDDAVQRMTGNAVLKGATSLELNIRNSNGNLLAVPLCVVKADEENSNYMLIVNSQGPCNQAALIVRDPEDFFSHENSELVDYLKTKTQSNELDNLDMVPFAKDCE